VNTLALDNLGKTVARRRLTLKAAAAWVGFAALGHSARARSPVIKIGMTVDMSGVEKANGLQLLQGGQVFIRQLNAAGGVNGSPVELLALDDWFKPDIAKENALQLMDDSAVVGVISPLGTRQCAAVMDATRGMALVGPSSGTPSLRKKDAPHAFFVRVNYDQELDKLVATANSLGITRIGLVHSKDALGEAVLAGFSAAMAKHGLQTVTIATTPNTTSLDVDPAARQIAKADLQVVVMGLAGTAPAFVQALRKAGGSCTVYGLSIAASPSNIKQLGDLARGLGFAIAVPSPFASKYAVVRSYRKDMLASGHQEYSLIGLEGWINARVMAEGLRRAGSNITRQTLLEAIARIDTLDLGGLRISYANNTREGGNFVDVAVVGTGGQMLI
jgi:branched-chain amino acid transport system substrate-binding protein